MSDRLDAMAVPPMDTTVEAASATRELLDERAFHALYAQTAAPLRAYVTRTLGGPTHADDVIQETYLRLLRGPLPPLDADQLRALRLPHSEQPRRGSLARAQA